MEFVRVLTGITPSGSPHLGNYVGAIRPAIEISNHEMMTCFYFLSDYHALTKCHEPERINQSSREIIATWLALGLDPTKVYLYRQSDIPEIMELAWILSCVTAKGLMNRAHAYKAAVDINVLEKSNDPDKGITIGLFCYPILMAADILMFNVHKVPVGKDQKQHVEMAKDIAERFNHIYGHCFNLPEPIIDESIPVLYGIDGQKMSKSYDNVIPIFSTEKILRERIMKIKTNSLMPGEPKNPDNCILFQLYSAFADSEEIELMRQRYAEGIAWGTVKKELFEYLNEQLAKPRKCYQEIMENPDYIEQILIQGAKKARESSVPFLQKIRDAVGIRKIH